MRIRTALRGLTWWFTSVLGDHDYAAYLDHMRRNHPGSAVLDERRYWRERYAAAETDPKTRCC
ncbi:YbdD/YjiX family protein [Skermania piniformis]|uniref:YbdD/YjiX family protein n=1 Tax=Skermania pinensis TaxID=39122 RepID=A0ABX8SE24_9ACTN|nr:YbdD/YjiX family protein [Skermania piniformis]QXQ14685.1 YbdD/YjiX family protein [Skermania piniformis]